MATTAKHIAPAVAQPSPLPALPARTNPVRRALRLLMAASSDWRATGPSAGQEPLHWTIAVRAARAYLELALGELAAERRQLLAVLEALREDHMRMEPHHAHLCPLCRRADAAIAIAGGWAPCPDCGSTDEGHTTPCGGRTIEAGSYRTALRPSPSATGASATGRSIRANR